MFYHFIEIIDDMDELNQTENDHKDVINPLILRLVAASLDEGDDPDLAKKMIEVADPDNKGYVTEDDFMNIMQTMGMF